MSLEIPIHLIVTMLLSYPKLEQWTTARTLNRESKLVVSKKNYDLDSWGRRTFLLQGTCAICNQKNDKISWLRYAADRVGEMRWIGHCKTWYCTVSALKSMMNDYASSNVYLLRTPWQSSVAVNIPRSNGSTSVGVATINCVHHKDEKVYVRVDWTQESENLCKILLLDTYASDPPKYVSI